MHTGAKTIASIIVLIAGTHPVVAGTDARPLGDSRVITRLPASPGFPEGIAVVGRRAYVSAPAQNGHFGPAAVYELSVRTGEVVRTHPVDDVDDTRDHALVGMAADGNGRIYVLDTQRGVVRIDPATGQQETYAGPIPDVPPCAPLVSGSCSPTTNDRPPLPNDIVFTPDGSALVTDSFQATIWRVPPGGGAIEPWFQDARFDTPFALNGIRLTPDRARVVFNVFLPGEVLSLPLDAPSSDSLHVVATLHGQGPDNLAFGHSGLLYVTLVSPAAVIALDADGHQVHRFEGPARSSDGDVPWDAPASLAFDTRTESLLVVNHALVNGVADPELFVVFDVYVADRPDPLERPQLP